MKSQGDGFVVRVVVLAAVMVLMAGGVRVWGQSGAAGEKKAEEKKEAGKSPGELKWGVYETHGEFEVGVRLVTDVGGNREMYRSMVNLGEGVKLLRSSFSMRTAAGSGGLFDHLDFSMNSWGGEPYNSARASVGKQGVYELRLDYRNLNYYNYIPTFANPLLEKGYGLGQHSQSTTMRTTDVEFKVTASRKVRPYFGYTRATGFGPGYTTWAVTGDEFLGKADWKYASDEYRGGVEVVLPRMAVTVEEGYRFYKDDTSVGWGGERDGNTSRTFLGETGRLDGLSRGYHDRVRSPFFKAAVKAVPWEALSVSARYVYASSDLEGEMNQLTRGNIVSLEDRLVYQSGADAYRTEGRKPSHNGSLAVEWEPVKGLRLVERFDARAFNVSGSGVLSSLYYGARTLANPALPGGDAAAKRVLSSYLSFEEIRNEGELEYDFGQRVTAHGGMRWTSVETKLEGVSAYGVDRQRAEYKRNTGLFGVVLKPSKWLHVTADYENNEPAGGLTRTDLYDYDELKVGWRAGTWRHMSVNGRVSVLRNKNGASDIDLEGHNRLYTIGYAYETERFSLNLDYTKTNLYSDLIVVLPQTLDLDRSLFEERGHGIGGSVGVGLYRGARMEVGYRGMSNAGEYPLNFHQPFAGLTVPLKDRLAVKTYWQYFGYNEKPGAMQDYRTHLVTFGLAYTR